MKLDWVWECPKCGGQFGIGKPGNLTKPPICTFGHARTEMEQKKPEALSSDRIDQEGTDGTD